MLCSHLYCIRHEWTEKTMRTNTKYIRCILCVVHCVERQFTQHQAVLHAVRLTSTANQRTNVSLFYCAFELFYGKFVARLLCVSNYYALARRTQKKNHRKYVIRNHSTESKVTRYPKRAKLCAFVAWWEIVKNQKFHSLWNRSTFYTQINNKFSPERVSFLFSNIKFQFYVAEKKWPKTIHKTPEKKRTLNDWKHIKFICAHKKTKQTRIRKTNSRHRHTSWMTLHAVRCWFVFQLNGSN